MRLIDADKIIYSWMYDNDGQEHDGVTLQSIIDKIPTVTQWIPCSEQMPPIGRTVLVTVKTSDKTWTDCDTWFQGDWMAYMGNSREVVAWCELPEPYKEATE